MATRKRTRPIVEPQATERCTQQPDDIFWRMRHRDIYAEIKRVARRLGFIRALRIPDELTVVKGAADRPAGWSSYAFVVPAKGTLRVTLRHPNEGWFHLLMTDKWGKPEEGMVQNLVKTGRLQVSFKNPLDELEVVYVIVDDPGWMSSEQSLYTLSIERDWEPGKVRPGNLAPAHGVWVTLEPIIKMEDAKAE